MSLAKAQGDVAEGHAPTVGSSLALEGGPPSPLNWDWGRLQLLLPLLPNSDVFAVPSVKLCRTQRIALGKD